MRAREKDGGGQNGRDGIRSEAAGTHRTRGAKWSDAELMRLLEESKLPAMTQLKLATKYGVSRARIGALLQVASDKLGKKPASVFTYGSTLPTARKRRVG
ncbi:hypothetical protein [Burkholderia contaminans]|uniref:hypothetical protein n=1 Tax=Burkholderia contaminans TaxID=488447 RepID=UPI003D66442B